MGLSSAAPPGRHRHALRILETCHPPVYYFPPEEVEFQYLVAVKGRSFCEWKGWAVHYDMACQGRGVRKAAWSYPEPLPHYGPLKDCLAFYSALVDGCYVDGERVRAQPGGFYGGWITSDIVGPFKGEPGWEFW